MSGVDGQTHRRTQTASEAQAFMVSFLSEDSILLIAVGMWERKTENASKTIAHQTCQLHNYTIDTVDVYEYYNVVK